MIHDDIERQVSRLGGPLWTLYGLSFLLTAPIEVLLPQPKKNPEQMEAERAEFKARIEDDSDDGVIEAEKADMIHSIISLPDTMVKEVMVPRVGMACFDKDDGFEELVRFMASSRHTRIPIYQDTVDNILGVVHAKDVLQHTIKRDDDSPSVDALIRDGFVLFVPE
ncbi:MAG: CBS domain-containing protein, partial [Candidatus Latescibacteria bacterium]|nr:CBS domain-containing protein [Candidatus Latescibacterota bacterium]